MKVAIPSRYVEWQWTEEDGGSQRAEVRARQSDLVEYVIEVVTFEALDAVRAYPEFFGVATAYRIERGGVGQGYTEVECPTVAIWLYEYRSREVLVNALASGLVSLGRADWSA